MDREAAVVKSEMSQTRAELDRKIGLLEERAKELRPSAVAQRHMPEFLADRAIGGVLTLIGIRMAWNLFRKRRHARRREVRQAMASYGRW
jgi:hypothetical protein